jgi:hypothetical protein
MTVQAGMSQASKSQEPLHDLQESVVAAVFRNWAIKWQIAIDFQNPNSHRSFFENYQTSHRPLGDGFFKKSAYTSL